MRQVCLGLQRIALSVFLRKVLPLLQEISVLATGAQLFTSPLGGFSKSLLKWRTTQWVDGCVEDQEPSKSPEWHPSVRELPLSASSTTYHFLSFAVVVYFKISHNRIGWPLISAVIFFIIPNCIHIFKSIALLFLPELSTHTTHKKATYCHVSRITHKSSVKTQ